LKNIVLILKDARYGEKSTCLGLQVGP